MRKTALRVLVVLVMGVIFYLSNEPASSSNGYSILITQHVNEIIGKTTPGLAIDWNDLHHLIRKAAHFSIYMILSICLFMACRQSRLSTRLSFGIAMMVCVVFAVSDEIHQLFIPGRSGEVRDVWIDSTGALVGLLLVFTIKRVVKSIKKQTDKDVFPR